jgi:hypothetical protein
MLLLNGIFPMHYSPSGESQSPLYAFYRVYNVGTLRPFTAFHRESTRNCHEAYKGVGLTDHCIYSGMGVSI